jgi:four helix bundle protein
MDIAVLCYEVTNRFPETERFGLSSQMRRASASIPANIAEGHGRETPGAFVQFLRNAQGSLKELETHLLLAVRVKLLEESSSQEVLEKCNEAGRMLRALIRTLQTKK